MDMTHSARTNSTTTPQLTTIIYVTWDVSQPSDHISLIKKTQFHTLWLTQMIQNKVLYIVLSVSIYCIEGNLHFVLVSVLWKRTACPSFHVTHSQSHNFTMWSRYTAAESVIHTQTNLWHHRQAWQNQWKCGRRQRRRSVNLFLPSTPEGAGLSSSRCDRREQ